MLGTCKYAGDMSKMIQVRHVPDPLHRKLKARAAEEGVSLSYYVLQELRRVGESPTLEEIKKRLASRQPVHLPISAAEAVRLERDSR